MEPAASPLAAYRRRSARSNAGVRSDDEDMVYYGHGCRSPRTSGRAGRVPSPRDDSQQQDREDSETEYHPWADRVDIEDADDEDGDDAAGEDEPVDEEAEGDAYCAFYVLQCILQRAISEVVAASYAGGRGPSVARAPATAATQARTAAQGPVNAAMAARASQQERRILELSPTIERLEGRNGDRRSPAVARLTSRRVRPRDGPLEAPAPIRQRTRAGAQPAQGEHVWSPMVEAALERELRQANTDGFVTEGMDDWANRTEGANKLIPNLNDGFKGVVEDAIALLAYDTAVRLMNFWAPPNLAESCVARALNLVKQEHFASLHMVWSIDEARTGWFTRQMQVWRNNKWEQGLAMVYILHGLPYNPRANPRVRIPVRPSTQAVPRISRKEFTNTYAAGEARKLAKAVVTTILVNSCCNSLHTSFYASLAAGPVSFELMPWHRNADDLPFATEIFERALFASFRRPIPLPLVLRTYVLAWWLFGMPIATGSSLTHSAPRNEEGVHWYHERVKLWMRNAILRCTAQGGPWWDADRRGWSFRRESVLVFSEDGMEELSPRQFQL
ncbi:unnamed protein product [Closterium sp. Yama58-4]|nr:unnamed protein product [Closterium sp. Yama58-4]